MKNITPMKNTRKKQHSDSYKTSLKRSEQYKQVTTERQQHRKNKRLKMTLGV